MQGQSEKQWIVWPPNIKKCWVILLSYWDNIRFTFSNAIRSGDQLQAMIVVSRPFSILVIHQSLRL